MPTVLAFPAWRDNPYLNLLYLATRGAGWDVQGTTAFDELVRRTRGLGSGDVLHVHWTSPICQAAPDARTARERLDTFVATVRAARASGVRLVWTVHNKLPHEVAYRDLELELAQHLTELADVVIQLNGHTVEAVADEYTLPVEKVVTLPHASYLGVYPDSMTQAQARTRLDVPLTSPTIGFVGQIRPYKGITTLLSAAGRVAQEVEDLTLLLAGKTREDVLPQVDAALPRGVRTVRFHDFVADADMQTWFRAADVMVFPYERVLNSGSVLLSATLGRPCVLPREAHLVAELGDEPWVTFYRPGGDVVDNLARAIRGALRSARRTAHDAAAYALRYPPYAMSRDFLRILDGQAPVGPAPRALAG
ncbi:glycosyltransferase family 4 protein [Cellulomonas palmilytica]|uniref:glycosyltransferase family 4 protein n=1 Tax=Cellulomonas palmilytica TaxID=2608402 RepID=UPI001F277313|nr:glycosyltransferase family 4 protein [Cellulomonas palmilytica]UJP39555.1 glycosyltransferase family 4 protein [Cellulomonas palmilytica]